mgnify:CR=1 FL=1
MMEHSSEGFTARYHATIDAVGVDSLAKTAVDFENLQTRSNKPDVVEGNDGELAAPFSSDAAPKAQSEDLVAQSFPQIEAGVGHFPYAVNTVGTVRLS